jgi:hypothetical protein
MLSKIREKKHIVLGVLIPAMLVGAFYIGNIRISIGPQGNTNPVIEWVVIQLSYKTPGNAGVSITIQGYNFTAANNEVRSRGKVLATGLSAVDRLAVGDSNIPAGSNRAGLNPSSAKILVFELPAGIQCSSNEECPLSVVNANGVSNTVTFRLSLSN